MDTQGRTPLMLAARYGDHALVELYLGCSKRAVRLYAAPLTEIDSEVFTKEVSRLVAEYAAPQSPDLGRRDESGMSALDHASNDSIREVIQRYLKKEQKSGDSEAPESE